MVDRVALKSDEFYILKGKVTDAITLIEGQLKKMGATGLGIMELMNSVADKLSNEVISDIRWCNRLRNSLTHTDINGNIKIPTKQEFQQFSIKFTKVMNYLEKVHGIKKPKNSAGLFDFWDKLNLVGKIVIVGIGAFFLLERVFW